MKGLQTIFGLVAAVVLFSTANVRSEIAPTSIPFSNPAGQGFLVFDGTGTQIVVLGLGGTREIELTVYEAELLYFAALAGQEEFIEGFITIKILYPGVTFTPQNFNPTLLFPGLRTVPIRTIRPLPNPPSPGPFFTNLPPVVIRTNLLRPIILTNVPPAILTNWTPISVYPTYNGGGGSYNGGSVETTIRTIREPIDKLIYTNFHTLTYRIEMRHAVPPVDYTPEPDSDPTP